MAANDQIFDATVAQSIRNRELTNGFIEDYVSILNKSDEQISFEVFKVMNKINTGLILTKADQKTLDAAIERMIKIRAKQFEKADAQLKEQVDEISAMENSFQKNMLEDVTDSKISKLTIAVGAALVFGTIYQGRKYKQWIKELKEGDAQRLEETLRNQVRLNATPSAAVSFVNGTKSKNFTDGLLHKTRLNSQSVIRQTTTHVQAVIRTGVATINEELDRWIFSAILDSRTTPICRKFSGRIFDVGKGPLPPLHIGCRSTAVAILKGQKAPVEPDYNDWLRRQSLKTQQDVLGVTNGRAYHDDPTIKVQQYTDRRGNQRTIKQMKQKFPEAYKD